MSQKNESIADKLIRLNTLVAWFESDEFKLELSLEKFAEAETVAKEIEQELGEFKHKITVLKEDFSRE